MIDFSSPYLTQQLIAYIGNKRRLLPLVYQAIKSTGLELRPGLRFFDAFSGSGSVSRLAKALGFELYSNDWETYAYILGKGFLEADASDIERLFGSRETFAALLAQINALPAPPPEEQYIAAYYAPASFDTTAADFRTERLFYTRQNALAIDKIRNYIEETYPEATEDDRRRRNILLASLIYEAATHTNTSGVFKAYHKGFGGHGKDALPRILKAIALHEAPLIDAASPVHVSQEDANLLVRKEELRGIDIAYLDPPYNQHQYGSNYHLLNSIARWDKIPAPLELNDKGELKEKAAIRKDWVQTKSPYCYRHEAEAAFEDLINHLDAKFILISYSTDGIIPFSTMKDICCRKGKLSIVTNEYIKYRGGKQSNKRQNTNIEFILCIDTSKQSDEASINAIDSLFERKKILLLFKQKFHEHALCKAFPLEGKDNLVFSEGGCQHFIKTESFFELFPPEDCDKFPLETLRQLYEKLAPCACQTKEEELAELLAKARAGTITPKLAKKIPLTLKKLANKKNKDKFIFWRGQTESLALSNPDTYSAICAALEKVKVLAEERFNS